MIFNEAKAFQMPFGEHIGKTLDEIAETDRGLLYLDWLHGRGQRVYGRLATALAVYLEDSTIKNELNKVINR